MKMLKKSFSLINTAGAACRLPYSYSYSYFCIVFIELSLPSLKPGNRPVAGGVDLCFFPPKDLNSVKRREKFRFGQKGLGWAGLG